MIAYFADKNMRVIGIAGAAEGMEITGDVYQDENGTGAPIIECYLEYPEEMRRKAERYAMPGGYVFRKRQGSYQVFTILESEGEPENGRVWMHLEGGGIDLICETAIATAAVNPHTIAWYIEHFTADSGFTIRINEFPNNVRTLSWDSDSTVMERILSIANSFGAELEFNFEMDGLRITGMYIDIRKKRGRIIKKPLVAGRDISPIRVKRSLTEFASALHVSGGTPEGSDSPITLEDAYHDDGDIYLQNGRLYSRSGREHWRRYKGGEAAGGWVYASFTYDTTSKSMLLVKAVSELRKRNHMLEEYSTEILNPDIVLNVGDTVPLSDPDGQIYVSARVQSIEESEDDQYTTVTFGEYVNIEVEEPTEDE